MALVRRSVLSCANPKSLKSFASLSFGGACVGAFKPFAKLERGIRDGSKPEKGLSNPASALGQIYPATTQAPQAVFTNTPEKGAHFMELFPVAVYPNKRAYLHALTLRSSFRKVTCIYCVDPQPVFTARWLETFCTLVSQRCHCTNPCCGFLGVCGIISLWFWTSAGCQRGTATAVSQRQLDFFTEA